MNLPIKKLIIGLLLLSSTESLANPHILETRIPISKLYQAFVKISELPKELNQKDPRIAKMPKDSYYALTVGFVNDNYVMGVDMGDDLGLTHGIELKIQKYLENGAIYSLRYDEVLYGNKTGRMVVNSGGNRAREQQVVTEKILELMYSTANKGHLFFYEMGAGWHRIDPNTSSFAATTQEKWHDLVLRKHHVVSLRGPVDEDGYLLEGAVGLMRAHNLGPLETDYQVKLGGRYSTLPEASYLQTTAEAGIHQKLSRTLGARAAIGVNVRVHSDGEQIDYFFGLEIVGKKFKCGVKVEQPTGDVMNYVGYNKPNKSTGNYDLIGTTFCQKKF